MTLLSEVPFAFIVKKFPSVKLFYTSAATDSSDKYEVWVCEVNPVSELHWKVKYDFACKPQHALIRVNEWPSAILCMHFHYCHSNPKNPIGFVGRGWGGVWICHVEFSHRDFTFVHVQSQWIPDNMEDMNNVNIELASVYSPEFRIEGSRKYIFLWWTAFIFIIFIFFIFIWFFMVGSLPSTRKPAVIRIAPTTSTNFGEFFVIWKRKKTWKAGLNYFSRLAKIVLHKRRREKFHGYFGVTEETPERKTESVGSTNHHEESSNLGKKISVATFYRDTPHVSPGGYFQFFLWNWDSNCKSPANMCPKIWAGDIIVLYCTPIQSKVIVLKKIENTFMYRCLAITCTLKILALPKGWPNGPP